MINLLYKFYGINFKGKIQNMKIVQILDTQKLFPIIDTATQLHSYTATQLHSYTLA